jgi:hypothetical protein
MKYIFLFLVLILFSCKKDIKKEFSKKIFCNNELYYFKNNPNIKLNLDLNQTHENIVKSIIDKTKNNIDLCYIGVTNSKIELENETIAIPYVYRKLNCVSARYNTVSLNINSVDEILFGNKLINIEEFKNEVVSVIRNNTNGLNVHLLVEIQVYKALPQHKFDTIITEFYKAVSMCVNEMSEISFRKPFCELDKKEIDSISSKLDIFFTNPEEDVIENY